MDFVKFAAKQWDRVCAWILIVVGIVLIVRGWFGVSSTPFVAEQMPYVVSAGLGGLVAVGLGAMLWLSADLRDEWRKLDELAWLLRGSAGDEGHLNERLGMSHEPGDMPSVHMETDGQVSAGSERSKAQAKIDGGAG